MKKIFYLLLAALSIFALASCEDNTDTLESNEFTQDWQNRNAVFFAERMAEAKQAVAQAKAAYGADWEEHCDWRIFRSYAKMEGGVMVDSICAKVIDRGTGAGSPLYTDTVKVNYMGHLIPTESYPKGRVFDHSGLYENEDYVFHPDFSTPARMTVSNLIEGFTTVLLHMHIGDRWMVYIPQELAYGANSSGVLPPYSTLCFDLQLKAFYRVGSGK